jgi:hypothetical protein
MAKGISNSPEFPLRPSIIPAALLYGVGVVAGVVLQTWLSSQSLSPLDRWLATIWAILCAFLGIIHFAVAVHELSWERSQSRLIRSLKRSSNGHKYKIPQVSMRMRVECYIGHLVFCGTGIVLLVPAYLHFTP